MTAPPTIEAIHTQRDVDTAALVENILADAVSHHASDVHLKTGAPPAIRVQGDLRPLPEHGPLTHELVDAAFMLLATKSALDPGMLLRRQSNFACDVGDVGRFRCHAFRSRGHVALALRTVPTPIPDLAALRLPPVVKTLCGTKKGLVLVTGPQGSGRSATVASMLQVINASESRNVVTLEAPIETVFEDRRSRFVQREVGVDVATFAEGLDAALREDADVVFVGALRTAEERELALEIVESGRLLVSTAHAVGARATVEGIVRSFPPTQRDGVRRRLADAIAGIVSQQLVPLQSSRRRVLVTEVLTRSPHVLECIREERRLKALGPALETATNEYGSHTFEQRLATMTREGLVSIETARAASTDVGSLMRIVNAVR